MQICHKPRTGKNFKHKNMRITHKLNFSIALDLAENITKCLRVFFINLKKIFNMEQIGNLLRITQTQGSPNLLKIMQWSKIIPSFALI